LSGDISVDSPRPCAQKIVYKNDLTGNSARQVFAVSGIDGFEANLFISAV
jgi:hypothetical protein